MSEEWNWLKEKFPDLEKRGETDGVILYEGEDGPGAVRKSKVRRVMEEERESVAD